MLYASHLAGKAINITKTTACHATSYLAHLWFITGNAVGITPEFLKWVLFDRDV